MERKYKESGIEWIREIPVEWGICKIKNLCSNIYSGGTPDSTNMLYWDGDIPWIPSGSCHDSIITEAPKFITQLGYNNSSTKLIPANTTVMAMTGATCGNVGFVTFETCMNQSVTGYITKDNNYSKFLFYSLIAARENILTHKTGGAQSGINVEDCKNIAIPLIPKEIQQRISNYLDDKCLEIDSLIGLQEQMIEKLKVYKKSVITEAVTKGINPKVNLVPSGLDWIGNIPEGRKLVKLSLVTSKIGSGSTPRGGSSIYVKEGVKFLRSQNVYCEGLDLSDVAYITEEIDEEMRGTRVQNGDVLLNITGASIGRCYYVDETLGRANVNQHVSIIRPSQIDSKYLKYYLQSECGQLQIALYQTGGNREGLSAAALSQFTVIYPSEEEQQSIASYLDEKCIEIDKLISIKQEKENKLRDYKNSIIYEAVTGKIVIE